VVEIELKLQMTHSLMSTKQLWPTPGSGVYRVPLFPQILKLPPSIASNDKDRDIILLATQDGASLEWLDAILPRDVAAVWDDLLGSLFKEDGLLSDYNYALPNSKLMCLPPPLQLSIFHQTCTDWEVIGSWGSLE